MRHGSGAVSWQRRRRRKSQGTNRSSLKAGGRDDDVGLLAEDGEEVMAAAWIRKFVREDAELGFLDTDTPVLVNAWVAAHLRGQGIGTAMLQALLEVCDGKGHAAVSLATDQDNPAVRLYWRLGFEAVAVAGSRWVLLKRFERGKG